MVYSTLNNYTDVNCDLFVSYEHANLSGRSLSPVPRVPQLPRCSADPPMWRNAPELAVFLLFVTLGLMWWRDLVDRRGASPRSQQATHLVIYKFKLIKPLHLKFKFKPPNLQIWWRVVERFTYPDDLQLQSPKLCRDVKRWKVWHPPICSCFNSAWTIFFWSSGFFEGLIVRPFPRPPNAFTRETFFCFFCFIPRPNGLVCLWFVDRAVPRGEFPNSKGWW